MRDSARRRRRTAHDRRRSPRSRAIRRPDVDSIRAARAQPSVAASRCRRPSRVAEGFVRCWHPGAAGAVPASARRRRLRCSERAPIGIARRSEPRRRSACRRCARRFRCAAAPSADARACARSTTCRSTSRAARSSRWSARAAAASPRSGDSSSVSTSPMRGASRSTDSEPAQRARHARRASARADGVPGSVLVAQSAQAHPPCARAAARSIIGSARRAKPKPARRVCWS